MPLPHNVTKDFFVPEEHENEEAERNFESPQYDQNQIDHILLLFDLLEESYNGNNNRNQNSQPMTQPIIQNNNDHKDNATDGSENDDNRNTQPNNNTSQNNNYHTILDLNELESLLTELYFLRSRGANSPSNTSVPESISA